MDRTLKPSTELDPKTAPFAKKSHSVFFFTCKSNMGECGNLDDAEEEQNNEDSFCRKQEWRYKITPIYDGASWNRKEREEIYSSNMILGRRELATLWWKHCPNQCQTHVRRGRRPVCREFCKPLCENVGVLSRQLLKSRGMTLKPHEQCRFPELVKLSSVYSDDDDDSTRSRWTMRNNFIYAGSYNLSIGPHTTRQVWMRFRVVVECASNLLLSPAGPKNNFKKKVHSTAAVKQPGEKKRPAASSPLPVVTANIDLKASKKTNFNGQRITPATKKRRPESPDSTSSCKRRLFDTQAQPNVEVVLPMGLEEKHPQRLFSSPLSSSFLSLPMPYEGSQLSKSSNESSLHEATQIQWPTTKGLQDAKSLSLTEWKSMQNGKGIFCATMADLIVARNAKTDNYNLRQDELLWLPSILSNAKIKRRISNSI